MRGMEMVLFGVCNMELEFDSAMDLVQGSKVAPSASICGKRRRKQVLQASIE
jgi:hypothetical protein